MDLVRLLSMGVAFAAIAGAAAAADEDPIDALFLLSHSEALIGDSRAACIAAAAEMSPERFVREDPSYLGGITPESDCWPNVEEAFRTYYEEACNFVDRDQVLEVVRDELLRHMTLEELREVVAFFRSPAGSKYVAASFDMSRKLNELAVGRFAETMNQARVRAMIELRQIILECAGSCERGADEE